MTSKITTTIVPYTVGQMFDLVADVQKYPSFLSWCVALRITEKYDVDALNFITADMVVAYKVFRERFKSKVRLEPETHSIDVEYIDGPFKNLRNAWRFHPLEEGGTKVEFEIDFEFKNPILQTTAKAVFDKAFLRMSEAFVERAHQLYSSNASAV